MQELGPNQELWLQALESGEYKQGRSNLCKVYPDGTVEYCCLGVANELFSGESVEYFKDNTFHCSEKGWGGEWVFVANDTVEILKLYDKTGKPAIRRSYKSLTVMNDNGESFKEIAALIRKNPTIYFKEPN